MSNLAEEQKKRWQHNACLWGLANSSDPFAEMTAMSHARNGICESRSFDCDWPGVRLRAGDHADYKVSLGKENGVNIYRPNTRP